MVHFKPSIFLAGLIGLSTPSVFVFAAANYVPGTPTLARRSDQVAASFLAGGAPAFKLGLRDTSFEGAPASGAIKSKPPAREPETVSSFGVEGSAAQRFMRPDAATGAHVLRRLQGRQECGSGRIKCDGG